MENAEKNAPLKGCGSIVPPPLFFVQVYFNQKGRTLLGAAMFFQYYSSYKWATPRGKKIRDWKAAANNWIWNIKQQEKDKKLARKMQKKFVMSRTISCEEAKQIDLVNYLASAGHQPQKISRNDYWFLSPLRDEKTASFKVNRKLNVWYDFGIGKGGNFVDFAILFHKCSVSELIQRLSKNTQVIAHILPASELKNLWPVSDDKKPDENNLQNAGDDSLIKVTNVREISDPFLLNYLRQRRIHLDVAKAFCKEVYFKLNDRSYYAIGFKNNVGGYEIRNSLFKGSSAPKYVTHLDNKAEKITVFEGFFDFLSYQTLVHNQPKELTNFLVLNSLSFFERSQLLMEKSRSVHLYLDNDPAGKACVAAALKRSKQYHDESHLYKGYKDLNDFLTGKKLVLKQSQGLGRHL
ncbi:MAG TPA: toprim domain-containing protein [Chitinophagaceae bacterium]|nr:toprim domain-containing protein [Chitinophagaceae bacterium]